MLLLLHVIVNLHGPPSYSYAASWHHIHIIWNLKSSSPPPLSASSVSSCGASQHPHLANNNNSRLVISWHMSVLVPCSTFMPHCSTSVKCFNVMFVFFVMTPYDIFLALVCSNSLFSLSMGCVRATNATCQCNLPCWAAANYSPGHIFLLSQCSIPSHAFLQLEAWNLAVL